MKKNKYYLLGVIALLILAGIVLGVSSKAQPDEKLYSVKLNILEKAIGYKSTTDLDRANFALELAQKRIYDLQYLKQKKLLESANGVLARDNFNQQTITTQKSIISLSQKEGASSKNALTLNEKLDVAIEEAKVVFNIDQLEVLDEGAPIPKATSTKLE